jgi:cellulose synthase/poly-beta-1,6-N-acetylglucosamine synthase-like glycosyltransferase
MTELADEPAADGAEPPLVSVIIPARNASATLERALLALREQRTGAPYEVIVVDDGSGDETGEIADRLAPLVKTLRNGRSQGPGAARNRGVAAARGHVLAFTDADCFPEPDWLACGVQALEEADIVQGAVIPDPSARRTPFERTLMVDRLSGFYQTANLFVRRDVFEAVGGFRDWSLDRPRTLFRGSGQTRRFQNRTPAGEDALFGWSARRLGARTRFAPEVRVHHAVFPSTVAGVIADRWHWTQDMPGLARLVPELRSAAFHRRWFFSSGTMQFDLAAVGLAAAMTTRRRAWLALALPYLRWRSQQARRWGRRNAPAVAMGAAAADAATLAGLVVGSVTWRSLVL